MKHFNYLVAASLSALVFAGCAKETENESGNPDSGVKAITVTINGARMSRAAITPGDAYQTQNDLQKMDIYFTNAANEVKNVASYTPDEQADVWEALMANGVRFVGLTDVSRVYVVANGYSKVAVGSKITDYLLELQHYCATKPASEIAYIGGDNDLTPVRDEVNTDVTVNVPDDADVDATQQYYTAEVAIRPVISRLEINSIAVVTDGETDVEMDGTTYTVKWSGFAPTLTGVYMSNFSAKEKPITPSLSDFFKTPTAMSSISGGKWSDLGDDLTQNGVSLYSNYENGAYASLFADAPAKAGDDLVYFDGEGTKCVPFNFFVPYDVFASANDIDAAESVEPHFHFQFQYADTEGYTIEVYEGETKVEDPDICAQVIAVSETTYPQTEDGVAYANVVNFQAGGETVAIKPSKIYRIDRVEINPFNLTTSPTKPSDSYNVIVKVTVIDFDQIDVTPGFE